MYLQANKQTPRLIILSFTAAGSLQTSDTEIRWLILDMKDPDYGLCVLKELAETGYYCVVRYLLSNLSPQDRLNAVLDKKPIYGFPRFPVQDITSRAKATQNSEGIKSFSSTTEHHKAVQHTLPCRSMSQHRIYRHSNHNKRQL